MGIPPVQLSISEAEDVVARALLHRSLREEQLRAFAPGQVSWLMGVSGVRPTRAAGAFPNVRRGSAATPFSGKVLAELPNHSGGTAAE